LRLQVRQMQREQATRERKLRFERLESRRLLDNHALAPWQGFFGDSNANDVIDAADYVIWRKTLGSTTLLAADANGSGMVDPVDYLIWKQNFGSVFVSDYTPAAVIVQTTGVTLPDGTMLDTTASQTHGLQEAFDYSAAEGWDVFVLPGTYTLNAPLDVEELQGRAFRLEDVTLNFMASQRLWKPVAIDEVFASWTTDGNRPGTDETRPGIEAIGDSGVVKQTDAEDFHLFIKTLFLRERAR